jgi:hypothetical protein
LDLNDELKDHTVYICRNGNLEEVEKPPTGFGRLQVNWQDGKIAYYESTYTKK